MQELVHLEEERGVKDDVQVLGFDHRWMVLEVLRQTTGGGALGFRMTDVREEEMTSLVWFSEI